MACVVVWLSPKAIHTAQRHSHSPLYITIIISMPPARRPSQRGSPADRHQVICFDALTVQFKESPKHHIQTTVFDNSKASRREKDRIVIKDDLSSRKNCLNRDILLPHSYVLPKGGKLFFRVQARKFIFKWDTLMEAEINFDAIKHALENPQDQGSDIRNDGFLLTDRKKFPKIYANFRLGSYLSDGLNALEIRRHEIQGRMSECHQFLSALAEQKRELSDIQLLLRALVHPFSQMTDGLQYQQAAHHEILELAENMTMVAGCILDCEQFASLSQLRSAIIQAQRLCQDITNFLLRLIRIGDLQQILDAVVDDHNRSEIDRLRKRFAQFMARFDRGVDVLSTLTEHGAIIDLNVRQMVDQYNNMLQRIGSILDHDLLRKLLLSGADYRIPSDCISGPLESLNDIMSWIDNPETSSNVMFLSDAKVASSQSTVIASTLVQGYSANQRLGSFFFFDKDKPKNTTSACVRRIAYDLAEQHPVVRAEILRKLKEHPRFLDTSDTSRLFTELIRNPMLKVDGKAMPSSRRPLIILGGVDECGSQREKDANAYTLLRVIQSWPELPSFCKLVLSSPITPATPKSKSKGEKLPPPVTAKVQQQNSEWRPAKFEDARRRMAHFFVDGDDSDAPLDPGLQFDAGLVQVDGEKAPEDQMVPLASEEPPAPLPPPVKSSTPSLQVPDHNPEPGIEDHSPDHDPTPPAVSADLPSPSSYQASQSNGLNPSSTLSHPVQDEGSVNSTSPITEISVPETTSLPVLTENAPDKVSASPLQGEDGKVDTSASEPQAPAPEVVVVADPNQYSSESGPKVPDESTASQKVSDSVATPTEDVTSNPIIAPAMSSRKSSQKTVHFSDSEDEDEVIQDWHYYPPEHEVTVADDSAIEDPPKSQLPKPEEIPLPVAKDDGLEPEMTPPEEPVPESSVVQNDEATAMPLRSLPFNIANPSPSEPASQEIAVPQAHEPPNSNEQHEGASAPLHEAETSADVADVSASIPGAFPQEVSPDTIDDLITHPPDRMIETASTPVLEPQNLPVLVAQEPEQPQQALSVRTTNAPIDQSPIVPSAPTESAFEVPPVSPTPQFTNTPTLTPEPEQEVRSLPLIVEPVITEPPEQRPPPSQAGQSTAPGMSAANLGPTDNVYEQTPPASQAGQSAAPGMSAANLGPADDAHRTQLTQPNIPSQPPRYSTVEPLVNAIPVPQEQTQPASNTTSTNLSLSLSTATSGAAPASSTTVIVIMTGNTAPDSLRSLFGAPSPVPQTPSVPTEKNVASSSTYAPSLPPPPEPFRAPETRVVQDASPQSQPESAARATEPEQQVRNLPPATVSAPEAAVKPIPTTPSPDLGKDLVFASNDTGSDHVTTTEPQNHHNAPEPSLPTPNTVSNTTDTIIINDNKSDSHHDEHHLIESSDGSDGEDSATEPEDEPAGNQLAVYRDEDIPRLVEHQDDDRHGKEAHDDDAHLVESSDESESEVTEADPELPGETGAAGKEDVKAELDTLFFDTQTKPEESGGDEKEVIKMDVPEEDIIKLGQVEEKDVIVMTTPEDADIVGESAMVETPDTVIMQDVQPADTTKSANSEENVVLADVPREAAIVKDSIMLDTPSETIIARDTEPVHEVMTVEAEEKNAVIMDVANNTILEHDAQGETPVEMAVAQDAQPSLEDHIPIEDPRVVLNDTPSRDETVIVAADVPKDNIVLVDKALVYDIPGEETIILAEDSPSMGTITLADKSPREETTDITGDVAGADTEPSSAFKPEVIIAADTGTSIDAETTSDSPLAPGSAGPAAEASPALDENEGAKPGSPSAPEPEKKAESAATKPEKSVQPAVPDEEGDEELPTYSAEPTDDQAEKQSTAVNINITNNNTVDGDADNETETAVSLSFSSKTTSRSTTGNSFNSMMNISINSSTSQRTRRRRKN